MQCYTELTPPTAVTHSLSLSFTSAEVTNLIVAKTSLLQIFALKTASAELDQSSDTADYSTIDSNITDPRVNDDEGFESSYLVADSLLLRSEQANTTKLVLIAEYALSGTVTSMVQIKTSTSKSGGDSLLISFRDAKLSLLEWDPERHGLSTVSIHYYEQEDIEGSPWAPNLSDCFNYIIADPGSRCAALVFGVRNLAILPFRQGDEDTAMDDWDEELDGPQPKVGGTLTNGDSKHADTPYGSSFVIRMSSLDPNLIHPVHLAFLFEYREPTFGILSSTTSASASLLPERKDHISYMVFTLDLEQKASTTILVVGGLPYDLFKVIALPAPVGGALLVGGNELIHIDQSGKSNGVAVNALAKQCTSFGLADQGELEMRLEGCTIEQLSAENGEMVIILSTGALAILSFKMDGRSVSGLTLRRVAPEAGGALTSARASCTSSLGRSLMFIGSEEADSVLLGWSRNSKDNGRRRSKPDLPASDESDAEDFDDDDDDLYGDAPATIKADLDVQSESLNSKSGDYLFRVHDSLLNIGPLRDITLSRPYRPTNEEVLHTVGNLQLVAASGRENSGSLIVLKREIEPQVIGHFEFPEARGVWTIKAKKPLTKALQPDPSTNEELGIDPQFDGLMIVSKAAENLSEESAVYALTSAGFEALTGTEFEPAAGATIEAGTLGNGMRVIQVLRSEVRSYDGDLGLAQILPMFDDETGAEPKIVSASIADPYLLLVRDDASIYVARCDEDNDLEEIEREDDGLLSNKWLSGCLYHDTTGIFASDPTNKKPKAVENVVLCLLSSDGAFYLYSLPDLSKPTFVAQGLCFVPPTLSPDYASRRSSSRETLTEILIADLGDSYSKSPFLIVRTASDDITIYEPFRLPSTTQPIPLNKALHFLKMYNPHLAKNPSISAEDTQEDDVQRDTPMRAISNLAGLTTIFLPGPSPSFVVKSSKGSPKVLGLRGPGVRGMSSFHTAGCDHGFIYVDNDGVARVSQLPSDTNFTEVGMSLRRVTFNEDIQAVAYHPPTDIYVLATTSLEPFELPKDDDYHREWQREETSFKPLVERSSVKLLSPSNWTIIDTIELDPYEVVMCMKTLNLEISETTHERKPLIAVGTAVSQGEDLPTRGRIHVFEIVTVVPQPDRPETNKKLKLIAKEDIPRGAVTGLSEIGSQGFLLCAQGQKCMVRGIKEDGTLLPVAFLDMSTYVTSIKELPGTGICVLGDAVKGAWLAGYAEDPYKMMLFGKQAHDMEVVVVDVLPVGKDLFLVVADSDCNLHILQFDPEHPKSLQGQLLLHRTTFSLGGHLPTTMTLLPSTKAPVPLPATIDAMDVVDEDTVPEHSILMTLSSGSISLLSPLSEGSYRRLSTLTNHLANTLYHAGGLNPKAYRINSKAPDAVIGGRAIVDGTILMRWMELGSQKRAEVASRVGVDVELIRDDLSALRGSMAYL